MGIDEENELNGLGIYIILLEHIKSFMYLPLSIASTSIILGTARINNNKGGQ